MDFERKAPSTLQEICLKEIVSLIYRADTDKLSQDPHEWSETLRKIKPLLPPAIYSCLSPFFSLSKHTRILLESSEKWFPHRVDDLRVLLLSQGYRFTSLAGSLLTLSNESHSAFSRRE